MHLKTLKKWIQVSLTLIGILLVSISVLAQDRANKAELDEEWVIVEQPFEMVLNSKTKQYELLPYRSRRPEWQSMWGLSGSLFEPNNYQSNFSGQDFATVFDSSTSPLKELSFVYRKNYSSYSIGLEMGIGSYATQSLDGTIDLSLMPVTLGLRVSLDGLYDQPWVVPYGSAGLYLMSYNEKQANSVVDGNTQLAAYAKAGLLILLDWIDPEEARVAFEDSSIDNTYFFIEGRMFFASSELVDPDFESDLHLNAGLVVEFY